MEKPDNSIKTIAILGMHRSGTSCLTGCLQEAGLHLGQVIEKAPYNAKGNRENKAIMDLNEQLLQHNAGSWDNPPENFKWGEEHTVKRDEIIKSYGSESVWGFKDPRTLFTLPIWRDGLEHITHIGVFRHPMRVAQSLQHRNRFPICKEDSSFRHVFWISYALDRV